MKRILLPLALILSAGLFSGCFETASLVQVKKDGSGTMTMRMFMSNQLTQGLQGFAQGFGGEDGGEAIDPVAAMLDEMKAEMKTAGENMGEGVSFQAGKDVQNKAGWKGYEAIFAFKDINTLKASTFSQDKDEGGPAAGPKGGDMAYTFKFTKGDTASLQVIPVLPEEGEGENEAAGDAPGGEEMGAAMLGMMKPMLAGMRMSFLVTVDGEVTETNAKFRPGNQNAFVLMDVQMDKVFDNPEMMKSLMNDKGGPQKEYDLPGIKVQDPTKPMVIKFK